MWIVFSDTHPNEGNVFYLLDGNVPSPIVPLYEADKALYDYNLKLVWNIVVKPEAILLLNILYMDIDVNEESSCSTDHLEVG